MFVVFYVLVCWFWCYVVVRGLGEEEEVVVFFLIRNEYGFLGFFGGE